MSVSKNSPYQSPPNEIIKANMKTLEQIKEIISQYDELISLVGGKIKVAQKADYFLYNTHRCIESITFENDLVL